MPYHVATSALGARGILKTSPCFFTTIHNIYNRCQNSINPILFRNQTAIFTFLVNRISKIYSDPRDHLCPRVISVSNAEDVEPLLTRAWRPTGCVYSREPWNYVTKPTETERAGGQVQRQARNVLGIAARMTGLQDGWPRVLVKGQDGTHIGPPHGHLHGQIKQPGVAMSHAILVQKILYNLATGRLVGDT